jgi:hypothetical protein
VLTDGFYRAVASTFVSWVQGDGSGAHFLALGSGAADWDRVPPPALRSRTRLEAEVFRLPVERTSLLFLTADDSPSAEPTTRFRIDVEVAGAPERTIRECGLFLGGTEAPESGLLISYHVHPRIDVGGGLRLQRSFTIDLTPSRMPSGFVRTSRYLGNAKSQELHDLEAARPACQIDELRYDHRVPFDSIEHALSIGYDRCAKCFAAGSQR